MQPVVYVVKPGDTLSEIALYFYGNGTEPYWRRIYDANKAVIGNDPDLIKPGEVLKIPFGALPYKYKVKYGDTLSYIALHLTSHSISMAMEPSQLGGRFTTRTRRLSAPIPISSNPARS